MDVDVQHTGNWGGGGGGSSGEDDGGGEEGGGMRREGEEVEGRKRDDGRWGGQ